MGFHMYCTFRLFAKKGVLCATNNLTANVAVVHGTDKKQDQSERYFHFCLVLHCARLQPAQQTLMFVALDSSFASLLIW